MSRFFSPAQLRKNFLVWWMLISSIAPSLSAPSAVFEFALPELEGAISLGIYDKAGKLIRTLAQYAPVSSFQTGLNGLIAAWDGVTNEGTKAPPGQYEVKGFVVGKMKIEAPQFHFNDWVETSDTGPFPTEIFSIFCAPRGDLLVLWNALSGVQQIASYTNFQFLKWITNLENFSSPQAPLSTKGAQILPLFAGLHEGGVSVVHGDRLSTFSLENGAWSASFISLPFVPTAACRKESKLLLASREKLLGLTTSGVEWPLTDPLPKRITDIFATSEGFLVLTEEGLVQEWKEGSWHRIPLPVLARKIAPGYGNTIWLIPQSPKKEEEFLGQFNIRGEFLRKIHLPSGEMTACLAAPLDEDKVFLLRSKNKGSSHLMGYQFVRPSNSQATTCQEFLRRSLIPSSHFSFFQNDLLPQQQQDTSASFPSSSSAIEVSLISDALNSQPGKTWLQAKIEAGDTAWLATKEGLPLLPIGKLPNASRAILIKKTQPNTGVLYCGNGTAVAEFALEGINNLHPIYAGSIRWK